MAALGDSVPSGSGCGCTPFPDRTAALLHAKTGREVVVHNLAAGGLTSQDVLDQLADPAVREQVDHADVVLVEIGANDFDEGLASVNECVNPLTGSCQGTTLAQSHKAVASIADTILSAERPRDARIVLMG